MDAQDVVDTVREPLLVLDSDLRVRSANRSFYQTFHVTPEQTEGQRVYDLGNGQWNVPPLRTLLEAILPQKSSFEDYEVDHEFPSIGRKQMLLNARQVQPNGGKEFHILLAFEDVTERRRLERERQELETRFTSLVKNIRDHSIFTLDVDGTITSWNHEVERILGHTESEALGRHFSIIFTPEDQAAGIPIQELTTALKDGRAEDERWHLRKSGETFWALGIVTPTRDAHGTHTGFSKILRDMTERKRAEEALQAAHDLLEVRVRTRTSELASANEKLRITGHEREQAERARLDVLRRLESAQEQERLRISREMHDVVGQMVVGLTLRLGAIETAVPAELASQLRTCREMVGEIGQELHKLAMELRPTALNDLGLAEALQTYVTSWSQTTRVRADFQTSGLDVARFTPEIETALYRIVQESLSNVAKHAKATEVSVVLTNSGHTAILIVEDNGVGFDRTTIGFDRLGLLGMRERVALAGGELDVTSEPGQGTTVRVRIPCQP